MIEDYQIYISPKKYMRLQTLSKALKRCFVDEKIEKTVQSQSYPRKLLMKVLAIKLASISQTKKIVKRYRKNLKVSILKYANKQYI